MRLLLLASLAVISQLPSPTADACGYDFYRPPGMFLVAAHHGRSFVLLGGNVADPDQLDWKGESSSYDSTTIAESPALDAARTMTVVGETGSQLMITNHHVFIKPVFETRNAMNALEILAGDDRPMIAIEGQHRVAWTSTESEPVPASVVAWAAHPDSAQAIDPRFLSVDKLAGSDLEMITAYVDGHAITYFRTGERAPWGGYSGAPLGAVRIDGVRYIVLVNEGLITPVRA